MMASAEARSTAATKSKAAATVAPLLQLQNAGMDAIARMCTARAVELFQRALVAAETALPRDSLVIISYLIRLVSLRVMLACTANGSQLVRPAYRNDVQLLPLAQRGMDRHLARALASRLVFRADTRRARSLCAGGWRPRPAAAAARGRRIPL
jgi:hypothetical protein